MMSSALIAVAAFAAAVAVAGCGGSGDAASAGAHSIQQTDTPVITGRPAGYNPDDVAFATNMVPHHKQAIALAALVPDRSADPDLVALAERITATQQPEVNVLNVFLVQWNENPDSAQGDHSGHGPTMPGMVDDATMTKLKTLHGADFDTLWLQSMISHHQGAVEMAKAEIANGANVDAISMAKTMLAAQQNEIGQMKQMLEGAKP
jgi:uncharacterized protein (DUF305 family)